MQSDCKTCPFKTKATSMLCDCSIETLTKNHLELKLKKGENILLLVPESARFSYMYAMLKVC